MENNDLIVPELFKNLSPMYQHYFAIQDKYPDAIICYQVGDFYEIWETLGFGNVDKAHRILDIKKTKRNKSDPESPAMCGFNVSVSDFYFKKLVNNGNTVIVVSQKINGRNQDQNKGVPRFIEKILTPGTIVENLSEEKSNYYACLLKQDEIVGVSLIDLSTGAVKITEVMEKDINDFLNNFNPTEILIFGGLELNNKKFKFVHTKDKINVKSTADAGRVLSHLYNLQSPTSNPEYHISTLGLDKWRFGTLSLANLVNHLSETEYSTSLLRKLAEPEVYNKTEHLLIPMNGLKSLEIFEGNNGSDSDTLSYTLDKCYTAMGRRKLREWLREPLISIDKINTRLNKVETYIKDTINYTELKSLYDIQRMSRRIFLGTLDPMDILNLYTSLNTIKSIFIKENICVVDINKLISFLDENIDFNLLNLESENSYLYFKGDLEEKLSNKRKLYEDSQKEMVEVQQYYNDQLKLILKDDKKQFREIVSTKENFKLKGAKGLYTSEVTKNIKLKLMASDVEVVDQKWIDISNKAFLDYQRYILKAQKEWKVFLSVISENYSKELNLFAEQIAEIDVLNNFARISNERGYNRPNLIEDSHSYMMFKNIRHPVVESNNNLEEVYIPNDVIFEEGKDIICIYGANSSGKSTLLKAIALNIIMAQIGCYISADKESEFTPFQNILTRMTTYDSLSEGLSTFTMEMKELKEALSYMNRRSLFLLDEIGRGTSVEDGEAIAYSTLEYLSKEDNMGLSFFATHYHKMAPRLVHMKNISIKNMETYVDRDQKISFTRKLDDGIGGGSYGIDVALTCGIPMEMIRIARNYNKQYSEIKTSRYNASVKGIICPICENNPVQETHHIIDQKQGRIKEIFINGVKKNINHKDNLIMICGSCHNKITRKEILLIKKEDV